MLCGAHAVTLFFWAFWPEATTVIHHSGYHLPYFDSSEFHDFHHAKWVPCNSDIVEFPIQYEIVLEVSCFTSDAIRIKKV